MTWRSAVDHAGTPFTPADDDLIAPVRIGALAPRRECLRLLVQLDGAEYGQRELVWALQEAARRDATVLAVALVDSLAPERRRSAALATLDAQVLRAVGLTGVHGKVRTALMDPEVFEAVAGTARGGELVVVRPTGKTALRRAVPRTPARRPIRTVA